MPRGPIHGGRSQRGRAPAPPAGPNPGPRRERCPDDPGREGDVGRRRTMALTTTEPTPGSLLQHIRAAVRSFCDEPQPTRVGWPQVFGSVLLFLMVVQGLTGFLLALTYSPSTDSAYESVR